MLKGQKKHIDKELRLKLSDQMRADETQPECPSTEAISGITDVATIRRDDQKIFRLTPYLQNSTSDLFSFMSLY